MFAGAAREVVFSNPRVVRRIRERFIPVALKAGLINNPPRGLEGRLYREIARSKPAPQGICVANSAGKVLAWALSFDDDDSVPAFLDHCLERHGKFPDASSAVPAERYMKFPSNRMGDVADSGVKPVFPPAHVDASQCPAKILVARGTVVARLWGRTLDAEGQLTKDCASQENYVEDIFHLPPELQVSLSRAVKAADSDRVRVPEPLARALVQRACLGQLDVMPGRSGDVRRADLWAARVSGDGEKLLLRIGGETEVAAGQGRRRRGDGANFAHQVKLTWDGFIQIQNDRITDLALVASGNEKLRWGNPRFLAARQEDDAAHLMAGRPIDKECRVRYGILGRPAPAEDTWSGDRPPRRRATRGQPPQGQPSRGGRPPRGLQRRLQQLHREIQRLVRQGREEEAMRLLDEVLKRFEKNR